MAITLVQSSLISYNTTTSTITAALSGVTAGNTLIFAMRWGNTDPLPVSMTDTSGNTWHFATAPGNSPPLAQDATIPEVAMTAWALDVAAASSLTVTLSFGASYAIIGAGTLSEWSGIGSQTASASLDDTAGASPVELTALTVPSGGLFVGAAYLRYTGTAAPVAPLTAFTADTSGWTAYALPGAGSFAADWGANPNGYIWVASGAVFAPAAVSPSSPARVVQQAAGSATSLYGFATTAISTSAGSWLAVLAGWNCVTSGEHIQVPAVSVTDSAGNLWQQAAITAPGTASLRCAAWVAPNALPVSWVSVGLTGFAEAAAWTVAEISGMPQAASLDFAVGTYGSAASLSLPWTAREAGIGFAVAAAAAATETVTSAPSGWTALGTAAAAAAGGGILAVSYWNTGIAAGAGTTAVTLASAVPYAYALCSVSASASPPPQETQDFPLVVTEAAFGARPGDISASTDYLYSEDYTAWTDISARVIGPALQRRISGARGRQYQLQQEETGTAAVRLSNVDGAFTPTSPGSPYYSNALNANMSFQSGVSPWTPQNGASLAQSTAVTYATGLSARASYSALVTCGTAASPGIVSELVPVNPNYPHTPSAWLYAGSAWSTGAQAGISWYDSAKSLISGTVTAATALPAGTWTQVSAPGLTPPAGAAYAQEIVQLAGTPGAGFTFTVAEAALAAGAAPARTGLVAPLVPVRVTAWWHGRRYPVWHGYAQKWPQEWPDMPQWGFAGLKAADALGAAAAGQMYSALIGEVLADSPYAYLPCDETYTTAITGATPGNPYVYPGGYYEPSDASGLDAVNRAAGNQIAGTYLDGSTEQVSTGLLMGFLGDNGTGMGATGYSGGVTGQRGPSMLYEDPALPPITAGTEVSIEFWFTWDGTTNENVTLLTLYTTPSAFMAQGTQTYGAGLSVYIQYGELTYFTAAATAGLGTVTPSQAPQHLVMVFAAGNVVFYLNGTGLGYEPVATVDAQAIVLGPGRWSCDCNNGAAAYYGYNFSAGHLAVYDYALPSSRILAHYKAGAAGWAGVDAGTRFSQILTWAQLGLKRGGWNAATAAGTAEITQIGPAYDLSGQPANSAVYALSQSEGGRYGTQANGSLIYLERNALYNMGTSAVLADGTAAAPGILNTDPGFATGTAGWTASGGAVSYPGDRYGSLGSLLLTPSGTAPGTASSPSFTYDGGPAAAGFWVNCPAGGTVTCAAATSAGTASAAAAVSGSAWTFIPVTVPAASGVTSAVLSASGTASFSLAWAALWYSPGSVPYDPKSSYGFDMTYIYNEVTATQQYGPNQLVLYDSRGTASEAEYFRRSALTFTPQVVSAYDVADVTTWNLGAYQQPYLHVSTVTVDAASNPLQAFPVILALEQGQVAQVNRNPVGGAPVTETGTVERVQHDIGPGYWRASYQLSPYGPAQAVMCADTAGYDAPGTTPSLVIAW